MAEVIAKSQRCGILQQSKASNHWDAGSAFTDVAFKFNPYEPGILTDLGVLVEQKNVMGGYGMTNETERIYTDTTSALKSIPFRGPVTDTNGLLAMHLIAAMQKVVENASTPYEKVITVPWVDSTKGANPVIDFSGNEGFLWHVLMVNIDNSPAGDHYHLENALIENYSFTIEANARGVARLAFHEGNWKGNKITATGEAGLLTKTSWVAEPTDGWFNDATAFTLNLTLGGDAYNAVKFRRFTFRHTKEVVNAFPTTGGAASNYRIVNPRYFVDIECPYDEAYFKFQTYRNSGANAVFSLESGTSGQDRHMKLINTYGRIVEDALGVDGDYLTRPLTIELLSNAGATPITITHSDAVDGGY